MLTVTGCSSRDPAGAGEPVASPSPAGSPALASPAFTEAPSATVAAPTATPSATLSGADDEQRTTVADPKAPQSLARDDGTDSELNPGSGGPEEQQLVTKGQARSTAPSGTAYTWHDGDRVERAFLATDLILRDNGDARGDDEIVARGASESIVRKQSHPAVCCRARTGLARARSFEDDWSGSDALCHDNGMQTSSAFGRSPFSGGAARLGEGWRAEGSPSLAI